MKRKAGLGNFQLNLTQEDFNSYQISDQGSELKLRAFLFRDGVLYKDGAAIEGGISEADIDFSTKRKVGQGASASVYYVLHAKTKEPLAMKEIPITTKTHRDEVSAELSVLAAGIQHPHVTRHFGAFWNAETHSIALVMEWMAYSLADLTKLFGNLSPDQIRMVAAQLVAGTRFIHDEKKVIHRDLKPSNVLINSAGQVKLGDFGIAKVVQSIRVNTSFVGTQLFMAPERLEEGEYGFESDVWSLGLTLISCATGKLPWVDENEDGAVDPNSDNQSMLFRMIQRMHSGKVPEFPPSFPPEAHDFAARCLDRDPKKRATAAQLAEHPFIKDVAVEASQQELSSLLAHVSQLTCRAAGGLGSSGADVLAE
uniref:mitogen-activated protein kinase kinase n=1 Tax=Neobodo designis TaxID=312471 RepID=A0A7S1Q3W6_NEODS|mmetsp:Transcript_30546/g.94344  ORF Transcript_30546/g.94344 Transcript_30546/m.94344 type:complete len:368 (+) Transcript_30546:100-1203(+)